MVSHECRVLGLSMAHGTDKAERRNLLDVLSCTHFVIEQLGRYDEHERNDDTEQGRCGVVIAFGLGVDGRDSACLIEDGVIRCVGRFLNLSLSTFLEEEGVVVIVDAVVTLDSYHLQLFGRQFLDFFLDFGIAFVKVFLLYLERSAHGLYNLVDHGFDVLDVFGELSVVHVLLRQFATLDTQVVELLNKRDKRRIVESERGRSNHCPTLEVGLEVIGEVVEVRLAQSHGHHLLVVGGNLRHELAGIGADIDKLILLSEIGHGSFGLLK